MFAQSLDGWQNDFGAGKKFRRKEDISQGWHAKNLGCNNSCPECLGEINECWRFDLADTLGYCHETVIALLRFRLTLDSVSCRHYADEHNLFEIQRMEILQT